MTEITHWADVVAEEVAAKGGKNMISTGITPSGHIHIGNMREVVTADAVYRAVKDLGENPDFYYIADNYDPLRKVYPFLTEEAYGAHVGKPISEIPCPCGAHKSYSEHFLEPFLQSMETLGIHPKVLRTDELYKAGAFVESIKTALKNRDKIATILKEVSGKSVMPEWSPFNPICENCLKINTAKVTGFDETAETVNYICSCGKSGQVPMKGGGKLTWRVEWPAKWGILGVTVEPFGKDHGSSGGSYDSGVRIAREVFGHEPPYPIVYEWIMLGEQGAMSSSAGVVVSISDMLDVVPPETLRFLIMKTKPEKHIKFDPGQPLLNLVDEYERLRDKEDPTGLEKRIVELSKAEGVTQSQIPFKQMVTIYQVAGGDLKQIEKIAKRSGFNEDSAVIHQMAKNVGIWLDKYAPVFAKFGVKDTVPVQCASLTNTQRAFLIAFSDELSALSSELTAEDVQRIVYETKTDGTKISKNMINYAGGALPADEMDPKNFFAAIYLALLGQSSGPKAGWFLTSFDNAFLVQRFKEAAAYRP
ncbi:lysine--tRNA ligase [Methanolapillus ohkumae]|uniref:Lysine--tRNA ligase n=1 Tax=Methanolapillus ohkumae TaxID=3028298 RepID=A0AA96V8Y6_9EURY|nr:Lysine--tRNA ligase [Methanosarcinaceae archaeon Am2]